MHKGPPKPHGESIPNLAPMVDIIMCLLIYFMLGASLSLNAEGVLQTELDDRSGPAKGEHVQVNPVVRIGLEDVDEGRTCTVYVMDDVLGDGAFEKLRVFMQQRRQLGADPSNPVIIGATGTVRYKYLISAFDACVRAGFKNVQFSVSIGGVDDAKAGKS